jgi:KUP system potassium uptake protein
LCQRFGTAKVGVTFAPITALWFLSLAGIGIYNITTNPRIFRALNPIEGFSLLAHGGVEDFVYLGGVFLSITGLEALYADLGHFGAAPIRISWTCFVLPSLLLNYLGQGAYLLGDNKAIVDPFFKSVPHALFWPMIILATLATVIASQAMITGCASLISQAISLGFFPPLSVVHTSKKIYGQIFVPVINYSLMCLTIIVVLGFQKSERIANAYGVTVSAGELFTTILYSSVLLLTWKWKWWRVIPFTIIFGCIDLAFLSSNLLKVPKGGYVSLIFGTFFSIIMLCWVMGQDQIKKFLKNQGTLSVDELKYLLEHPPEGQKLNRFPGMGVFVTNFKQRTPPAFINLIKCVSSIPETVVFLTVQASDQPFVLREQAIRVKDYGHGIFRIRLTLGYAETNVSALEVLKDASEEGLPEHPESLTSFFLHREHIFVESKSPVKFVPFFVYSFLKRLFSNVQTSLILPDDRVVEVGIHVKLE